MVKQSRTRSAIMSVSLIALSAALVGALGVVPGGAQVVVEAPPSISKLVPNAGREVLPDLNGIVRNRDAAVALGKALFWDQQVGSDGQACASCHFAAGADSRVKHQLNPGLLGGDDRFAGVDGFSIGHPDFAANYELKPGDFPFHRLADPNDRNSQILATTNDVSSSQGTFAGGLVSSNPREGFEACGPSGDDRFDINAAGDAGRRVEPRNTPTTINAVLNHRNFWDGRANNVFNGVDPFGLRSEKASPLTRVVKLEGGSLKAVKLRDRNGKPLENFSIASQAVGPTLSDFEMGCAFRSFAQVGRRLFSVTPLGQQELHPQDSDLARYRNRNGIGLRSSYSALIRAAFEPVWWRGDGNGINATFKMEVVGGQTVITPDSHGFTHMEHNFSMFWGGAVGLYEAELVSDQTPFDAFIDANGGKVDASSGNPAPGFGTPEIAGFRVFMNEGKCINCHKGPLFTAAALTHLIAEAEEEGLVERMLMADQENGPALYDNGFYNIGVRPTAEDIGVGGEDPFGNPLSFTRQYINFLANNRDSSQLIDPFQVDPTTFEERFPNDQEPTGPAARDLRVAVDGAFKTPGLRNIALTPPYFHNGGQATLEQVVAFYNRGGDRRGNCPNDTTATNGNCNLDPDITNLGLSAQQQADLVAFMEALTDERVRCDKAPFDHPALTVPNGHEADADADGLGEDIKLMLPATGRNGGARLVNDGNLFN